MSFNFSSAAESAFYQMSGSPNISTLTPYIQVDNFPTLGLLTSLRFLEWVSENPEGVISLPTGKTPEYFIKYTQFLLENWDNSKGLDIRSKYGLEQIKKPDLSALHFVQIDEFYPIDPNQQNSFCNYVLNYYIKGFGLDTERALLINSDEIPLSQGKRYEEVFPDSIIDLSLRFREAKSPLERLQQDSIISIDNWCIQYENRITELGGIGFFLGGIGPDGHIAFNTRGSDHHSTTRLTPTNFETQAVAAGDLGGIEISKRRLVITIGLETITRNPDAVAILFAAGEAKADIVQASLENTPDARYPATVLQKVKNSRFYLTQGAASKLSDQVSAYYQNGAWNFQKTEKAVIDLCQKLDKYGHHLTLDDLKADPYCCLIPDLSEQTVAQVIESIKKKMAAGMAESSEQSIYHTGPHHDDIMLGIMPYTNRQVSSPSNQVHFSVLTSGFTAVTNKFIIKTLKDVLFFLDQDRMRMTTYPDFFSEGFQKKWDKDVYHFLDGVADRNPLEKRRALSHRMVRALVKIWKITEIEALRSTIGETIDLLQKSYDGSKNPTEIQWLKGMLREFEEELVWAHFGVPVKNIHHLRLGFYKGDVFTEQPEKERDMLPILEDLRRINPSVISLAMDPEGSGPDTHYKVLQAIVGAVKEWSKEKDLSDLKIVGYRNVWFKFHPAEADLIVPVSLNDLDILENSFADCYMSQVDASFPSFEHDGMFNELTQKIWVQQLKQIQLLLGKNYFYQNDQPLLRATHGLIYIKEMNLDSFIELGKELEQLMEGALL